MKFVKKAVKITGRFFIRWKRLFYGILACTGAVFAILGLDSMRRKMNADNFKLHKSIRGDFKSSSDDSDPSPENITPPETTEESSDTDEKIEGFTDIVLTDTENIGKGSLAVINSHYAPMSFYTGLSAIESDDEKYTLNSSEMFISEDVFPDLANMLNDYTLQTEKNNMVIYNTTEQSGSLYTEIYPESVSGYSFDIAVNSSYGEIIEYDGCDTEGWISENCHNYGFITRYPQGKEDLTGFEYSPYHFRYVGIPHALIMTEENMCLEEYTEYIKDYKIENPLKYTSGDKEYSIYYSEATVPSTTVYVPENESYTISGNNYDGYIVSYCSGSSSVTTEATEEQ